MMDKAKLFELLQSQGYTFTEDVNIWETGLNHMFKKQVRSFNIVVAVWMDNQGGPPFWMMSMRSHLDLEPDDKFMHPGWHQEISPIIEEYFGKLDEYERIIKACHGAHR